MTRRLTFAGLNRSNVKRFAGSLAAVSATLLTFGVVNPTAQSVAAENTATTSIAVDDVTSIEMHVTANCVKADNQCYFTTAANLRTPDGPAPFPDDVYAKQNTTVRSTNRLVYVADSDFDAANTRIFKSIDDVEFATVYLGGGPPEKFMVRGNTHTVDWSTGQPRTDAGYIACAFIQVVYGGVNLTTPTACAQTTYS
jgi:hypothetical protein